MFEGKLFKSPSAFSVYVKRKVNPGRKADDGWTSVKYKGEVLSAFRNQLEQLLSCGSNSWTSEDRESPLANSFPAGTRQKRKARSKFPLDTWSEEDASEGPYTPKIDPPAPEDEILGLELPEDRPEEILVDKSIIIMGGSLHRGRTTLSPNKSERTLHTMEDNGTEYSWIQCENPLCGKWRKVKLAEVPSGVWYCSDNLDPRYNACTVSQELPDEEIDKLLDESAAHRYVASAGRPSLSKCTAEEFEVDLANFLVARGEDQLATFVREKRITCNNSPLDVFGLYREVIKRGGFMANERYDERGRWIGGINFAGEIFPKMKNYTINNRATSVGNQLLNNYKKFLLSYERAYKYVDLCPPSGSKGANKAVAQVLQARSLAPIDALAFLADVAEASDEPPSQPAAMRKGSPPPSDPPPRLRKRRRMCAEHLEGSARRVSQLIPPVSSYDPFSPGQLLLAQDPRDLSKYWVVVAASLADVPAAVAKGGCLPNHPDGFPLPAKECTPSGDPSLALPVVVLGTQWCGWLEKASCRAYSLTAGESALASAWSGVSLCDGGPLCDESQPLLACVRGLKQAEEYYLAGSAASGRTTAWVQVVGCQYLANRLLQLEGQLPADCLLNQHHGFWHQWRSMVGQAESPAALASHLLMFAYQLSSEVLCDQVESPMWEELQLLLGTSTKDQERATWSWGDEGNEGELRLTPPCVLTLDAAVDVIYQAVDWLKVWQAWQNKSQVKPAARVSKKAVSQNRGNTEDLPHWPHVTRMKVKTTSPNGHGQRTHHHHVGAAGPASSGHDAYASGTDVDMAECLPDNRPVKWHTSRDDGPGTSKEGQYPSRRANGPVATALDKGAGTTSAAAAASGGPSPDTSPSKISGHRPSRRSAKVVDSVIKEEDAGPRDNSPWSKVDPSVLSAGDRGAPGESEPLDGDTEMLSGPSLSLVDLCELPVRQANPKGPQAPRGGSVDRSVPSVLFPTDRQDQLEVT